MVGSKYSSPKCRNAKTRDLIGAVRVVGDGGLWTEMSKLGLRSKQKYQPFKKVRIKGVKFISWWRWNRLSG
jgi:hypothetical protein